MDCRTECTVLTDMENLWSLLHSLRWISVYYWHVIEICAVVKKPTMTETIRLNRLHWFGHVQSMEENRISKRVVYMNLETMRLRGRPRNRWQDEVREGGRKGYITGMEEAPENGKESSHSAYANGMNVIELYLWYLCFLSIKRHQNWPEADVSSCNSAMIIVLYIPNGSGNTASLFESSQVARFRKCECLLLTTGA